MVLGVFAMKQTTAEMMNNLWQQRRQAHFHMLAKYLRLIVNDQFLLVLLATLGGIIFAYGNWLKQLSHQPKTVWWGLLAVVICAGGVKLASLVTLIKPADKVFLLAINSPMKTYFKRAFYYSLKVASIWQTIIILAVAPLLTVVWHVFIWQFLGLLGGMVCSKAIDLMQSCEQLLTQKTPKTAHVEAILWGAVMVAVTFYWQLQLLGLLLIVLRVGYCNHQLNQATVLIDWQLAIEQEKSRRQRQLNVIALFCDVAMSPAAPSRRKYLDGIQKKLTAKKDAATLLYWTTFLRSKAYFNLGGRLAVIGAILAAATPLWWGQAVIGSIFCYMFAVQLKPLKTTFLTNGLAKTYPLTQQDWLVSFEGVFSTIVFSFSVIMTVLAGLFDVIFTSIAWQQLIVVGVIWLLVAALLGKPNYRFWQSKRAN